MKKNINRYILINEETIGVYNSEHKARLVATQFPKHKGIYRRVYILDQETGNEILVLIDD